MPGSDDRAEVQLGVRGQEETIRAADDIRGAYTRAAHGMGRHSAASAARSAALLAESSRTSARASRRSAATPFGSSAVFGRIDLDEAVESAERYNETIARVATVGA